MKSQINTLNKTDLPEGFSLTMALIDALPVLFFCGSIAVISAIFDSKLFLAGACLAVIAGCGKVLWKLIIAIKKKNVWILNRQMRFLMPPGFLLMLVALPVNRSVIDFSAVGRAICSFPSVLFFVIGITGMTAMGVFAKKLDGGNARSNWIEQLTNTVAQASIFTGLLFLL